MGVKGEAYNLHFMAFQRVVALASLGIPNLCLLVKRAGHNLITVRIIESHTVDNIGVLVETE